MSDVYQQAIQQMECEAPREMVDGFKEQMEFIRVRCRQSSEKAQCCLKSMSDRPTWMELLVSAFVVNGGVLFKQIEDEVTEDNEWTKLIQEIDSMTMKPPDELRDVPTDVKSDIAIDNRGRERAL